MSEDLYPVAILAGGLATRLLPVTRSIPKALVEIGGEPFIVHQLRLLRNNGVTRVVICVGHLGEMIQEVLGDRASQLGVDVAFAFDGPQLLGTAGALRNAVGLLGDAFFVLYGDSYLTCNFRAVQAVFEATGKPALMTVFQNDGLWDRSNVEFVAGQILAYDKSNPSPSMLHIDYGLGLFRADTLTHVPEKQRSDLAALYQLLLERGDLAGYEVAERFYEIGSPDGLAETRALLAPRHADQEQFV